MQKTNSAGGRSLLAHLVSYASDSDEEKPMDEDDPEQMADDEKDDRAEVVDLSDTASLKQGTGLVSYIGEDDEGRKAGDADEKEAEDVSGSEFRESPDDDLEDRVNIENVKLVNSTYLNTSMNSQPESSLSQKMRRLSADEVTLPPEPQGRCSRHLQEKINSYYKKGYSLNQRIQTRKDFRNPSIYEKLISYLSIEELGTNYPKDMYDPYSWEESSYYEALSKAQRDEIQKRKEKEKKERTKVEFVTGMVKKPHMQAQIQAPLVTSTTGTVAVASHGTGQEEEKKRKSKWDNPAPTLPAPVPLMQRPQVAVITTTITATSVVSTTLSATGAKTTVISSIGTIKKHKAEK